MDVDLQMRLRELVHEELPFPGRGKTRVRHRQLMEVGREDLSLARLAEAHYDAVAILAEAGQEALSNTIYGVWASERPEEKLSFSEVMDGFKISGKKMFCSGAGIIDHALVTVGGSDPWLFDVDLKANLHSLEYDNSEWHTAAFGKTGTSTVSFHDVRVFRHSLLGDSGWYLNRPGFWHGACGPAACWAAGFRIIYSCSQTIELNIQRSRLIGEYVQPLMMIAGTKFHQMLTANQGQVVLKDIRSGRLRAEDMSEVCHKKRRLNRRKAA